MTRRRTMKKILEVKNVTKKYQNKEGEILAIQDINLRVNKGEFVSIIGPSRMWKIYTIIYHSRFRRQNIRRNLHRRRKMQSVYHQK